MARRKKHTVFVLMPFDTAFDRIYAEGIVPACEAVGVGCQRIDKQLHAGLILIKLYREIRQADLLIADLTGKNPNVFYEAGLAHALGKKVILVTQNADDVPFDLQHYSFLEYGTNLSELRDALQAYIETLLKDTSVPTSPFEKRSWFTLKAVVTGAVILALAFICFYLWYVYPLPMPTVSTSVRTVHLSKGQREVIRFQVRNSGGPSTIDSYFTVSVSSGIDIVDWSVEPDSDVHIVNQQPGQAITAKDGDVAAQYEMFDCYKRYGRREMLLVRIVIEAQESGKQWVRYRAAFDTRRPGYDFVRFPAEGPLKDQQGYPVQVLDVEVGE